MLIKKRPLSRRHFLRCGAGGLGAIVTLPALEAMFGTDRAYAQSASGPARFLAIYQPNGHRAQSFAPDFSEDRLRSPDLTGYNTEALQRHMDVTTIFKNFNSTKAGGRGNAHLNAITSWLRGTHTVDDSDLTMQRFTLNENDRSSADVVIARRYEQAFPLPGGRSQHLVIRGSAFYDGGNSGYNNRQKQWLSTAPDGTRIDAEFDLLKVYNDMFAGFDPDVSEDEADARLRLRKSVLDSVLPEVQALENRLGASDKQALDSYFTNIRTLENRLQTRIDGLGDAPVQVTVPNSDELILHKGEGHNSNGWYVDDNYNGRGHNHIDYHWRDTSRLLTVAFQNETVRSVAYMLETEAGENHYDEGPNGEQGLGDNHGASHANNAAYGRRDARHAQVYAEMLDAFKEVEVGGERLIDNTLVLWGGGIGVTHSSDRTMAVVSGLTKPEYGIQHDTIRNMKNASQKPFMQTLLRRMGVLGSEETFGQDNGANANIDLES
ncbi:MAG: DUF1552 domain-containing protein [Myxococcota bacterium]